MKKKYLTLKTKAMVLFLMLLLFPKVAFAGLGGLLTNIVFAGLSFVLYGIFKFIGYVFWLVMKLLDLVISGDLYDAVFFSPAGKFALNQGWVVVRDFFNLFFILILVFVAISIILGIEKYNDKKIIFKVIISAILINFSKAITLVVIDISQLVMNFFANAISGASFTSTFAHQIGLGKILTSFTFGDGPTFFVALLFATIFMFIITGMMMAITVAMMIRLVAFWVLIILSPAAMFGLALPNSSLGKKITSKWSEKLISWAFFGPIMMFFLWLALVVVSAVSNGMQSSILGVSQFSGAGWNASTSGLMSSIFSMSVAYIAAIYLLYYGYDLSQSMSDGAAKSTLGWGKDKINKWGVKAGSKAAYYTAAIPFIGGAAAAGAMATAGNRVLGGTKDFKTNYTEYLNPNNAKGAMDGTIERAKENKYIKPLTKKGREEAYQESLAKFSGSKKEQEHDRKEINTIYKDYKDSNLNNDKLLEIVKNEDGKSKRRERIAAALHLTENGKVKEGRDYSIVEGLLSDVKDVSTKENLRSALEKKNMTGRFKAGHISEVKQEIDKIESLEKMFKDLDNDLLQEDEIINHILSIHSGNKVRVKFKQGKLSGKAIQAIKDYETRTGSTIL